MQNVKYQVVGACFVNDTRYSPRADGKPVYITARDGLKMAGLKLVEPPAAPEPEPALEPPAAAAPKAKETTR